MGDLGPLFVMLVVFALIARTVSVAKRQQSASRRIAAPEDPGAASEPMLGLLAEMRREVELARRRQNGELPAKVPRSKSVSRPIQSRVAARLPRAAEVAVESIRPTREVVDYDTEAAGLVASRTAAAELTAQGRPAGAHKAFDDRIREVGAPVVPRTHPLDRLRTAMIWREILGPPVSLQPPTD